jgi:hypothetical protein
MRARGTLILVSEERLDGKHDIVIMVAVIVLDPESPVL